MNLHIKQKLRILLVEDDLAFSAFLQGLLALQEEIIFDIVAVASLAEGRDALQQSPFDLILLDLSLPDAQGQQTLLEIQQVSHQIPIVILTSTDDNELAAKAVRLGAQDYITKSTLEQQSLIRSIRHSFERRRLLTELEESEARFRHTFEQVAVGIAHISMDCELLRINQKLCDILHFSHNDLLNTGLAQLFHIDDANMLQQGHQLLLNGERKIFSSEAQVQTYSGSYIWVQITATLVRTEGGEALYFVVVIEDIQARKTMQAELRYNAHFDLLTQLPNRTLLYERLQHAIQRYRRHSEQRYALLFLDLDGFKQINDGLGHISGDLLLQQVALRLKASTRDSDLCARWGGDEFAVLLESVRGHEDVEMVCQRLQTELCRPFQIKQEEVFVSASIGVVHCHHQYTSSADLLRDADIAMYHAKDNGRAQHSIFQADMHSQAHHRLQLTGDLERAIERGELRVYYQPVVDLTTEAIVGFEALVRWLHPTKGFVYPDEFIPLAEETGLIIQIDRWVLQEACQQTRIWQQQHPAQSLHISVNLSSQHTVEADLLPFIEECLVKTGLSTESLRLEITEGAIIQNQQSAIELFHQLKQRNIGVYMDDFGTGYSSLSYIQRFSFHALKVDRSFIRDIGQDRNQEEVIQLIIYLAQKIGIKVVAEGIETREQRHYLQDLGCHLGQGYLFAKPLPHEEAGRLWLDSIRGQAR